MAISRRLLALARTGFGLGPPRPRHETTTAAEGVAKRPRFLFHAAVYLLLQKQGDSSILLARRHGTGFADGMWSLPGGHIDGGETIPAAARRELHEELGLDVLLAVCAEVRAMQHRPSPPEREYFDFYVKVAAADGVLAGATNREPLKCAELRWCDRRRLPDGLLPSVREALASIDAGRAFSSFGFGAGRSTPSIKLGDRTDH